MTMIHNAPAAHSGEITAPVYEVERRQILNEYLFPHNNTRVEVVSGQDFRVKAAHEIEVAAMVELGDPEDEVRAEFAPHMESSIYFLAFDIDDEKGNPEDMKGMGRVIPSSEENGNKSLADLASIEGWEVEGIKSHVDPITGRTAHSEETIYEAFKKESGCESLDTVWDISTLGFKIELGVVERVKLADSIINAFSQQGLKEYYRGNVTHVTSFNEKHAHEYFVKLGYPFKNLFDLGPMLYDSFGTDEGMTAQPAWFEARELDERVRANKTKHLGGVAAGLCINAPASEKTVS